MIAYNIYYGTIGNTLGVKYYMTKKFNREEDAVKFAKNAAASFFYKNEGKYGLPSFSIISKESDITGLSIEDLYNEHIDDMMRWYAIPSSVDTISSKKLRW